VDVSGPVDCEPANAFAPPQPPEALQAVVFREDHVNTAACPFKTVLGRATMPTVGTAGLTVTEALCVALPPGPVQVTVNVVLAVSAPVDDAPVAACAPDQPPEATQLVAFWLVQVS